MVNLREEHPDVRILQSAVIRYFNHRDDPDQGAKAENKAKNGQILLYFSFMQISVRHGSHLINHQRQKQSKQVKNRIAEHLAGVFQVIAEKYTHSRKNEKPA